MEPKEALGKDLEGVHGGVETPHVVQFMGKDVAPMLGTLDREKAGRNVDAPTQQTPHERLPHTVHDPNRGQPPEAVVPQEAHHLCLHAARQEPAGFPQSAVTAQGP